MASRCFVHSVEFRRDMDRAVKHRKCDFEQLKDVTRRLLAGEPLEPRHKDHALRSRYPDRRGGFTDCRECHVSNDWLIVYRYPDARTVHFIRTGTHADLF